MKAKDLAELLLQHPDFDVNVVVMECTPSGLPDYKNLNVDGIADIGYSDKVILLDCNIEE